MEELGQSEIGVWSNGPRQLTEGTWDVRTAKDIDLTKEEVDPTLVEAEFIRLEGKLDLFQRKGMDFELLDISAEGETTATPRNP